MALVKAMTTDHGIELPEAYIIIEGINYSFLYEYITINVSVFASKTAKENNSQAVQKRSIVIEKRDRPVDYDNFMFKDGQFGGNTPLEGEDAVNPMHQSYLFIKKMPEFEGAIDA